MKKITTIKYTLLAVFAALFMTVSASAQNGVLYTVNDGGAANNQIYGYSVNEATGVLTALAGFPVSTGFTGSSRVASQMLTVDRLNLRLYVVSDGATTDRVSAYSINPTTGALTALPFSPITLPSASYYTIKVHPSGSPLIVSSSNSTSASYNITATTATTAAGSPFSTTAQPFTSGFSRDGNFFYVGGFSGTTFSGFSVNPATGVLTPLSGSPFAAGVTQPEGYATDAQGRIFVASFNGGSSGAQVAAYTTVAGVPTQVAVAPSGLLAASDGVLHPNGNFFVAVARSSNNVGSYQISGTGAATTLAAVAGSPVATGGTLSQSLAFNNLGNFLYVANGDTRNLTTYAFNTTTGVLTNQNVQAVNTNGTAGRLNGLDYYAAAVITAASVSVAGRVRTPNGKGLTNAFVTLTDASGNQRLARTSAFGYFRFEDVAAGETYIVGVFSKRYRFTPQVLSITQDIADLELTGENIFSGKHVKE